MNPSRSRTLIVPVVLAALLGAVIPVATVTAATQRPNILLILADDLGYGDVRCLNPNGKIPTPRLDRLAAQGMIFTDAHSSSAVCTPTRYGILTGRYNWRSRLQNGVLGGFSPRLIEPGRLTVAAFLQHSGYTTACIGKWHLGFSWQLQNGGPADDQGQFGRLYPEAWNVDYSAPILDGPLALGFDSFFGISASLDMPPYVFIKNDRATELPTVTKKLLRDGPAGAAFEGTDVLPRLTQEAVRFLSQHAQTRQPAKPFFLYLPLTSPHTPILPSAEWQGRSGINPYADFVMQTDSCVGEILDALDRTGRADETLVIFTSDNGCSPAANLPQLTAQGHHPSHIYRGAKADIFEGGHRVPFIARWPHRVKPGSTSQQSISLTDFFATFGDILDARPAPNAAEDSVSFLPALKGRARRPLREAIVHHSINGSFAIRQGPWKLILAPDSGGWSEPRPGRRDGTNLPPAQLYHLERNPAETRNLAADHPRVVTRLNRLLEGYVSSGRSTPGPRQTNTVPVHVQRILAPAP